MNTKLTLVAVSLLAFSSLNAFASAPNMNPGMWEITTETEMPGMPMPIPPQTIRQCYKNENVKEARETLPIDKDCKIDDLKQNGNTFSWKVSCNTETGPMSGVGNITYAGQSYSGKMTLTGKMEGMNINMTSSYSGKRVGDCK